MRILDQAVWSVIYEVLLYPEILLGALEREFNSEQNEQTRSQIQYLGSQIKELKLEDEQLYKAYLADAFDEHEYAEHRSLITHQLQKLQGEIGRLEENLMSPEQFEERKQEILAICQNAKKSGLVFDAPFEVRRRIISTIVDKITLNANEGWFEIEGVINGQYLFGQSENNANDELNEQGDNYKKIMPIVCNPKGRDSSPRLTRNQQKLTILLQILSKRIIVEPHGEIIEHEWTHLLCIFALSCKAYNGKGGSEHVPLGALWCNLRWKVCHG